MNAIARGSFEVLSTLTASFRTAAFVEVLASWISGAVLTSGASRPIAVTARRRTLSSGSDPAMLIASGIVGAPPRSTV